MRRLFRFFGGVHPPQHKAESTCAPIAPLPLPQRLAVPLNQHIGNRAKPLVTVGDRVLKGQLIGAPDGRVSTGIHAPTSGTVTAVEERTMPHPSGLTDLCIEIEPDGRETWAPLTPIDLDAMDAETARQRLAEQGIAGLGGAVFPTHMKLRGGERALTLVINGAECEPYISCDDRLMRERAAEIIGGAAMMARLLPAERVLVGIEDNKPEAIAAMRAALAGTGQPVTPIEIVAVPTIYPGGGAKQLIRVLTGIEVPAGERSTELGVQCFNVATAAAIYRAVTFGEPLLSRIVTVTGNVAAPRNYEVLLGTPIADLVAAAGEKPGTTGFLMGGPMMGFELPSTALPVVKASNCIIAKDRARFPPPPPPQPCIRCGRCAEACPAELQPQELYWYAKAKDLGKAQELHLFDCIECGCCAYVCPSHIPLVDYYRFAKGEIWAREREKAAADAARARHQSREARLEREKEERAARLAAKSLAAKATSTESAVPAPAGVAPDATESAAAPAAVDPKKAAIEAALARARAKQAGSGVQPKNTDNLSPEVLAEIAAVDARRAAASPPAALPDATAEIDPKKAAIQAALARARARQAASGVQPKNTDQLPPHVQAEIAEIDARRAAAAPPSENDAAPPPKDN